MSEDFTTYPVPFKQYRKLVRPMYYHRDGTPIVDDEKLGINATLQWAMLFEDTASRIVGNSKTLYGERLSTVWLGLDYTFGCSGPPLIFETMLFAPEAPNEHDIRLRALRGEATDEEKQVMVEHEAYVKKHYPHDELQLRYATEREAHDRHEQLRLQCLVPPRWRRWILGVVGGDSTWLRWEERENDGSD